ncbi:hypothetical protein SAMN06295926_1542 [Lysinibacillus sp. AC-3]|nr:hypothetical protein SAMN06295926_1542 [Lysinibacillus sp. AC-3]
MNLYEEECLESSSTNITVFYLRFFLTSYSDLYQIGLLLPSGPIRAS